MHASDRRVEALPNLRVPVCRAGHDRGSGAQWRQTVFWGGRDGPDVGYLGLLDTAFAGWLGLQVYAESRGQWRRGSVRTDTRDVIVRAGSVTHVDFTISQTQDGSSVWEPKTAEDAKLGPPVQQASNPAEVPDIIDL